MMVLMFLVGLSKAVMDTLLFHYDRSVFNTKSLDNQYWDPRLSWENKYVDGDESLGRKKWLWGLINKPVLLTDAWHLFQSFMLNGMFVVVIYLAISDYSEYPRWLMLTYGLALASSMKFGFWLGFNFSFKKKGR